MSTDKRLVYLALGDSYTIGTGASHESRNWPSLIAARIEKATGKDVELVNPSVNGFTTVDLIARELGYTADLNPQLISVLIGVNDLVQGRRVDQYRESLVEIYDAIAATHARVAAVSIPNWSIVPAATEFGDPARLKRLTDEFNAVAQAEAASRNFLWIDITDVSSRDTGSAGWIAADDLHPGDVQYAAWAEVIWDALREEWTSGTLT
ncbi:MAG TPA: SGNH/GDSL hydrolase family protein [Candidatus Dormibacteraeota bacterium]